MKLYTGPLSMFSMKVEIAMREKGIAFDRVEVAYDSVAGYSPKHPDVLRINPKGQVPVLIDGDVELFDSTQLLEYLEDMAPEIRLWPTAPRQRARARLLEHKSDEIYFPNVIRLMGLQDRLAEPAAIAAVGAARAYYLEMERQIGDQPYLLGSYTFADVAFYMAQLFGERMGATMTSEMPQLLSWRQRVGDRPAVRRVIAPLVGYLRANMRPVPAHLVSISGPSGARHG